ncbi:MAG: hypothetical protein JRG81_11735 [Deltaproteobacteria bacterium]|nr:hypothetical protein [Deltaproteobacteria bacterium]
MIDAMHANNARKPNFYFTQRHRKFDLGMMGSQAAVSPGVIWAGDIAYLSGGSKLMPSAMASDSWMGNNKDWSSRLENIKGLVISDRYEIDAERLAEKMLGNMVGVLMAS